MYTPVHIAVQLVPPPAVSMQTKTGGRRFPSFAASYEVVRKESTLDIWNALLSFVCTTPAFSRRYIFLSDAMIPWTSFDRFLSRFQCGISCCMCTHSRRFARRHASHMSVTLIVLNMGSPLSCFRLISME